MRAALWTPEPEAAWARALVEALPDELVVVTGVTDAPPDAEIDLHHLAGSSAHGFVYRALLRRPGVLLLGEWGLGALVHAETAERGDAAGYRREAAHAHGERGRFVARQVLAGLGGRLEVLLAMNLRVLELSLAVAVFEAELAARARRLVPDVILLPCDDPPAAARRLAERLRQLAPLAPPLRQARLASVARELTPYDQARDELLSSARELGLGVLPPGCEEALASLLGEAP